MKNSLVACLEKFFNVSGNVLFSFPLQKIMINNNFMLLKRLNICLYSRSRAIINPLFKRYVASPNVWVRY